MKCDKPTPTFTSDDGFAFQNRVHSEGGIVPWRIGIKLDEFGKAGGLRRPGRATWALEKNTAKARTDDLEIQYENDKTGMRQNFVILRNPPGNDHLRLRFIVDAPNVQMEVNEADHAVLFHFGGQEVARYAELHVFDSEGSTLPASFVGEGSDRFQIVVDDSAAVYPVTVDPLTYVTTLGGDGSSSQFGFAVAPCGNIKGHTGTFPTKGGGILIGAPYYDIGTVTDAGKVFVFYSGSGTTLPSTPTWTATTGNQGDRFGWSVAGGRDFNGDGRDDIAIGAPYFSSGGYSSNGNVFVWHGTTNNAFGLNSDTNGIATLQHTNWSFGVNQNDARFGWSLAVGDVNADGYNDLAVGAPYYVFNSTVCGGACVFHGSASGFGTGSNWSACGSAADDHFGWSVAIGGLTGESPESAELIVSAPESHSGSTPLGRAFVYKGTGSGLESSAWVTLSEGGSGTQFGYSVAVGKVYGNTSDGSVIVGAPKTEEGQAEEGKVFVYAGGPNMNTNADWSAQIDQTNAHFGKTITVGDINPTGDNFTDAHDLFIGAPDYDYIGYTDAGAIFLWYGSYSGLGTNGAPSNVDWWTASLNANSHYGAALNYASPYQYGTTPAFIIGQPEAGDGAVAIWKY